MEYRLSYPNYEVKDSFLTHLLDKFSAVEEGFSISYMWEMIRALRSHDVKTFFKIIQVLFANIDYDMHLKYEKYYQTIFYLTFKLMGLHIDAEVKTNDGRIDTVINLSDRIYLFEFKIDDSAATALKQINDKKYYQKYELEASRSRSSVQILIARPALWMIGRLRRGSCQDKGRVL